jgi:hypothetical protein
VRKSVKGSFIKLQDGFAHYDIAGPVDGPVVVLVHGTSLFFLLSFSPAYSSFFEKIGRPTS